MDQIEFAPASIADSVTTQGLIVTRPVCGAGHLVMNRSLVPTTIITFVMNWSMSRQSAKRFGGRDMLQHIDLARFFFGWPIPTSRETR